MNYPKVKAFDNCDLYDLEYFINKFAEKHEIISVSITADNHNWFHAMVLYKDLEEM